MDFEIIANILTYVTSAPLFWASMGLTTSTAMFIGVLLYDGNVQQVGKGALGVGSYAFFLMFTTVPRVYSRFDNVTRSCIPGAFAGTTTIVLVTLFYMLGLVLGVLISRSRRQKYGNPLHD